MSQEDVLNILRDIDGVGTSKDIKILAKKKFPSRTLHLYVNDRLKKLERSGKIERVGELWKIKKKQKKKRY